MFELPVESLLAFAKLYASHTTQVAVRQHRGYRMESWTYARIIEQANRVARELASRGLKKGDAVLLWGPSSAEWIASFFACMLSGLVVVPIDDGSADAFARQVASEVSARVILCNKQHSGAMDLPTIELESVIALAATHDGSPFPSPPMSRADTLEIIFTSGTTAEPRGVVLSHGNVLANIEPLQHEIEKYLRYEKWFHPIRFLNLLPLSHVFGQMLGVFIPPLLAGSVVFVDSLKPGDLVDTIRNERISVLVAVPRFIESLQREMERYIEAKGQTESFRQSFQQADGEHFLRRWWRFRRIHSRLGWKFWAFISGGAALPEQPETFWNRLGYAVVQGYGMTETTSLISLNHPFRSTKGSIGKVFPGMEVKVDENGQILVRGENVASAYRQNGRTQSVAEGDGWFRTGDVAGTDENGHLFFKGRSKNVIVTPAGMNVFPEDLERALKAQPGVRDCVVIGNEREGNAEPYAVLLLDPAASGAQHIVDVANQSLADYQKIRDWLVWPETDFPRTPTQKPVLPRIREAVRASEATSLAGTRRESAVTTLIEKITGRAVDGDAPNLNLESDLHLSSLDRVELVSALEERYQIDLNETRFQDAATLGQLEKLLSEGPASPTEHVYPRWPQSPLVSFFRLTVYYLLAWPATYLLAAPRIRGRENLRGLHGPALVIANHVTYLDIAWVLPALPARFRNKLATAMRGERLAEMRKPLPGLNVFGHFMERLRYLLVTSLFNVFPLPKQSGFLQSFHFAGDLVDRRWNILVFPEGQTSEDGKMVSFRSGIGLLAKHLNIPVVPIYLGGLFDLKRDQRILARPGHVFVNVGAPVTFAPDQQPDQIAHELERLVRELASI